MPKRRNKGRKKRRKPQQQLPRPSRGGDSGQQMSPAAATEQQPTAAAQATMPAPTTDNLGSRPPDRRVTGTVLAVEREFIRIDVDGQEANIYASELMLDVGETPSQRYIVGDRFDAFVFQMEPDPDSGLPQFSIRRASPYPDALNRLEVGAIVNATVVNTYDVGIELDIDGVRGNATRADLPLATGESPHDRYQPGDALEQLFVWQINHDARDLALSLRRNAPSYVEALTAHSVGEVVSAIVTGFQSDGGLWLDVDGVIGAVSPDELPPGDSQSAQERYPVGSTVEQLFIWQVNRDARDLALSVRRSAPGYVEALAARSVGDLVSGVVTDFQSNGGLWLNVDGVIGSVPSWDLPLADGESVEDRYPIGDTINDLFVWQVNRDTRDLFLSVRRSAPGYVEALDACSDGEVVSGVVTDFQSNGGLWLDVDGVIGGVSPHELSLDDGQSAQERYPVGSTVEQLFVWQVDHDARDLALSVRRNAPGYVEAFNAYSDGEVVSGVVTEFQRNGGLWLDVDGIIGAVSPRELSLADGQSAQERYAVGDTVDDLFVWQIDHDARDLLLSVRRNAPGYVEALTAHSDGEVVDGVVTQPTKWGIWLDAAGVVGWIPATEMTLDEGQSPRHRYAVGDTVAVRVWQVDHVSRDIVFSVRRLDLDSLEDPIALGATIGGVVRDMSPGGIRVLVAGNDLRVPHCELSLFVGDRPRFKGGQGIQLVVLAVDSNGQPTALSHRRALSNWQAEVNRLVPGIIVQNAEIIPLSALPPGEDRTGVDLGPVTGFVDHAEIGADDARAMMREEANTQYSVVIESIDADDGAPIVSNGKFEERWRELAENVSEGDQVQAELRHVSHDNATLDLGSGLLATMPADQLPTTETPAKPHTERIGEMFSVLVTRKDESARAITVEHRDQPIERLIRQGESEKLEFKATLRRSPRTGETDAAATFGVMKSIVGFLNSWDGGTLLVGVNDRGILITGPADEVGTMAIDGFANEDEMARALKDLIKNRIGASVFEWLTISFTDFRNSRILRIDCEPADDEVWLKGGKNGKSKEEDFFLRTPAATDPLNGRELVNYIKRRFHGTRTVDN